MKQEAKQMSDKRSLVESRPSRRDVLAWSAQLALASSLASLPGWRAFAAGKATAQEPWADVVELGKNLWAVLSKPLAEKPDYRTLCNGGIVAGAEKVLVVEGFARDHGAKWVGETARELTGKWPTDVVISHFHGDHVGGLGGFVAEGEERPRLWITAKTLALVSKSDSERDEPPSTARDEMLKNVNLIDADEPTELDLGGRTARLHPRGGHTPSDVTVELDAPSVVFCGDLIWNQMFPNYRDAIPTELSKSVRAALRKGSTTYVAGHGPLADAEAVGRFMVLIDHVEETARKSFADGVAPEEAGKAYKLPEPVHDWVRFNERYFEVAMRAWHRELESSKG